MELELIGPPTDATHRRRAARCGHRRRARGLGGRGRRSSSRGSRTGACSSRRSRARPFSTSCAPSCGSATTRSTSKACTRNGAPFAAAFVAAREGDLEPFGRLSMAAGASRAVVRARALAARGRGLLRRRRAAARRTSCSQRIGPTQRHVLRRLASIARCRRWPAPAAAFAAALPPAAPDPLEVRVLGPLEVDVGGARSTRARAPPRAGAVVARAARGTALGATRRGGRRAVARSRRRPGAGEPARHADPPPQADRAAPREEHGRRSSSTRRTTASRCATILRCASTCGSSRPPPPKPRSSNGPARRRSRSTRTSARWSSGAVTCSPTSTPRSGSSSTGSASARSSFDRPCAPGELLAAHHELGHAAVMAHRAIAADPWAESPYRLLASVHLERGDRSAARRVLEHLERVLGQLGVEPGPETESLRRRCLESG